MSHIQPQYQVLDDMLQRRLFRIPDYQRAYSWVKRQREDLFGDIKTLIEKDDERHHFMATIVCLKTPERAEVGTKEYQYLDVVDGQQRLTTLILLLKAIGKTLSEGSDTDKNESQELDKLLVKGDERLILLQTNHDSSMIYSNYLRNGIVPKADDIGTHADKRLASAIKQCEHFVSESDPIALLKVAKNRLGFIFYELQHESAVYTVFEVLNSRGLPVDPIDKCKSMLMGLAFEHLKDERDAAHDFIRELHAHWKDIYNVIGLTRVPGSEILRFGATLSQREERSRTLSEDDSLDHFRKHCETHVKRVADTSKWLLDVTKTVVPLYENPSWSAVTEITQARLLAVALLLTDTLDDVERKRALRQWENVTFRAYAMFDVDSRYKVGEYTRLAHQIAHKKTSADSYAKIMQSLRSLGEEYSVEGAVEQLRDRLDCYEAWQERLRYFLYRYEQDLAAREGSDISEELWKQIWSDSASRTIEHIAPQEWKHGWADDSLAYYQKYLPHINRLGNLMLLPPGLNSEAGQKSFDKKKKIYKKNFLRMMNDVLEYDEWKATQIKERTNILLDWALVAFADVAD